MAGAVAHSARSTRPALELQEQDVERERIQQVTAQVPEPSGRSGVIATVLDSAGTSVR
jgi:hypothetical protein